MTTVHVSDLRKNSSAATGAVSAASACPRSATSRSRSSAASAGHPGPERLREVHARAAPLDAPPPGGSASIFGHVGRESRAVRRLVNRVSVEASFFKKMSSAENLALGALLRDDAGADGPRIPRSSSGSASARRGASRWRTSPAACSRRSRSRAAHRAGPASSSTSRRPGSTRARASRCGLHPRAAGDPARPSSSARTTSTRRRRSPTGSGSSTAAGSSASRRRELEREYGVGDARGCSSRPRAVRSRTTR